VSVFLDVPLTAWVAENAHAFAFRDRHPVSLGHTLVVTRRVVLDWFLATDQERRAVLDLVDVVKAALDQELQPDGYNVGFNSGRAAGQTVMHFHVHVIPRYLGDMDDPSGGVRNVIPSKGNYLRNVAPLVTGGEADPFAPHVLRLFDQATEIAIIAAFTQESGLNRIGARLHHALARGAQVRIITGDYFEITQVSALELLLDWQQANAAGQDDDAPAGKFEARVVEVLTLPGRTRSFHPKSWRFSSDKIGVAFVGSTNLSRTALEEGIEWNLRVDRDRDAQAYNCIREAFELTWDSARKLDSDWIHAYAARVRASPRRLPPGEAEADPLAEAPTPHPVQLEAMAKLRESRAQGRRRALVFLATGLGKTWLAAFDYRQLREEISQKDAGKRPRLLFIAHRRELLRQAANTYRVLLRSLDPEARVGWFLDAEDDLDADLVFASVAKLARPEHLARLRATSFDYVVIDEVHHAAAATYRRILDALDPGFLLGLTATPDRADAADFLGLFDDHIAFEAGIARGVAIGRLVPFHYFGVKDDIDYTNIPWRNLRFDLDALAAAAQTEARMATLWRAWQAYPGERSLVFCCSIGHVIFVREQLRARGLRVAAVYSGEDSDDRDASLLALERGELDALCSIDIFNEGVDLPSLDRVVMLRPTESSVVFLQQLGRGLRSSEAKSSVTIIDFVGNHRIFLERVRALLSLAGGPQARTLRVFLESTREDGLPAGCSVELELEAKELLSKLFRVSGADEVERAYRELRLERGARPTAGELQALGYLPSRLRYRHGSWLDFVRAEGDLDNDEVAALDASSGFLRDVETMEMRACLKMVTLAALIEAEALLTGLPLCDLALRSHTLLRRSPELFADVAEDERHETIDAEHETRWIDYWRRASIAAWTTGSRGRRTWFALDGDRLVLTLPLALDPALEGAFTRLTRELLDHRLAQHRARRRQTTTVSGGQTREISPSPPQGIVAYPDLRAAAGHALGGIEPPDPDQERVILPIDAGQRDLFAVRVAGTSMEGGQSPLYDGDWAVMSVEGTAFALALLERVVLVQVPEAIGNQYQLKRLRQRDERLILTSDNPEGPTIEPNEEMRVIAQLVSVVRPQSLGPKINTEIKESDLASCFDLETLDPRSGHHGGHLFFFVNRKGLLETPDRLNYPTMPHRPGETAFALAKQEDGTWLYLGVARQIPLEDEKETKWRIPPVDQLTWGQWGKGREASRPLPPRARARAELAAAAVLALPEEERWIEQPNGQRARVIGAAKRGGLRVDGGEGSFEERTVLLIDIGWVIVADDDVREHGGTLDEPRVNRLRYQEGTSKSSTRWIDTGWALAAWKVAKRLLP